jgi:hypothetical protein
VDQSTISAIAKWPDVPYCYGWLFLDRRGSFRIRNEYSQKHHLPGELIKHSGMCDSIRRNIYIDPHNQYFFQNGPQRVYLSLAYCPYVVRFIPSQQYDWVLQNHLSQEIHPTRCFLDEKGNILLEFIASIIQCSNTSQLSFTETQIRSIALLHDHDLNIFSELSQMNIANCGVIGVFKWRSLDIPIEPIIGHDVAKEFHFKQTPIPA